LVNDAIELQELYRARQLPTEDVADAEGVTVDADSVGVIKLRALFVEMHCTPSYSDRKNQQVRLTLNIEWDHRTG